MKLIFGSLSLVFLAATLADASKVVLNSTFSSTMIVSALLAIGFAALTFQKKI